MVAEQMICIITPPQQVSLPELQNVLRGLDTLFRRIGRVHFASAAVLPGCSNEPRLPSLMLELVVDDRLPPARVIDLLVQNGFEELWLVYGAFWNGGNGASELVRRNWLRDFLLSHVNRASGGFVGARDRNVAQILSETQLFETARDELHQRLHSPDADDRASLARGVAKWAADQEQYRWAAEPAPRSFWRSSLVTPVLRPILALGRLVLPLLWLVVTVLAIIAGIGLAALVIAIVLPPVKWTTVLQTPAIFGANYPYAMRAIITTVSAVVLIALIAKWAIAIIRSVTVAAFMVLVVGMVLLAIGLICLYFWPVAFLGLIGALVVLVRSAVLALLGVAAAWSAMALAFLAALLICPPFMGRLAVFGVATALTLLFAWATHCLLGALVAYGASMQFGIYPELHQRTVLGMPAIDAIVLMVLILFSVAAYWLITRVRVPPFVKQERAVRKDQLDDYDDRELLAAHQVHPTIDECEASLARERKPAHMLSVTDIRRPYWFHGSMLRFYLWLVTYLGHTIFVNGRLANADGIRFAHWHLIDNRRRFLFCSNYDGSFGGYLDEFINGTSEGINLFWRWTVLRRRPAALAGHPEVTRERKFPPTRLFIFAGCKYEQWFKAYARDSMLPHIYRFTAYDYSAQDVERATRLRESLFGLRTPVKDDQMMRALES